MEEDDSMVYLDEMGNLVADPDAPLIIRLLCEPRVFAVLQEQVRLILCEKARERARDANYPHTPRDYILQEYAEKFQCEEID